MEETIGRGDTEMRTQKQDVLDFLLRYGRMTRLDAFRELGVAELSARIIEIEEDGWVIPRETVTVTARNGRKARVTEYRKPYRKEAVHGWAMVAA